MQMTFSDTVGNRPQRDNRKLLRSALAITPLLVTLLGAVPAFAQANAPATAEGNIEAVVVTGSRVIRDGYSAPTPTSVIGAAQIEQSATPNIADYVNTLPSLSGSATPTSTAGSVIFGTAGINGLNLRNLAAERTLVLLNGQRIGGAIATGVVDVSELPQQLVSRVDVVTGGASSAYGSDALAGVVNFVLDTSFTGIKGEISGGVTEYGDDKNWKTALSAGTSFADGRGHILLSGEASDENGIRTDRPWNSSPSYGYLINPAYTASNGLPRYLYLQNVGLSNATEGGMIACTATSACAGLRGIAFGPGGNPYNVVFGSVVSDPLMSGGTWQGEAYIRDDLSTNLKPTANRQNLFGRVAYKLSDDWEVHGQASWGHLKAHSWIVPNFFQGNLTVRVDNAFLPSSVAARATALGLTSFGFGTMNGDIGQQQYDLDRKQTRFVGGVDGRVEVFSTPWKVNAYVQQSTSRMRNVSVNTLNLPNYNLAIDAVRGPNGSVVCRSTLTNPTNGCVPYNLFGLGVNSSASINYVTGNPVMTARFRQTVASFNVSGEPFSNWAGPVSLAFGAETRRESAVSESDKRQGVWFFAAGGWVTGKYNVTEAYAETVVPLLRDVSGAKSLDLNAAVRLTNYSTSGNVTTWKAGLTYSPIDDLRFRATRSRDIRAPNLYNLFAEAIPTVNSVTDPFNGNVQTPAQQVQSGNAGLVPEEADTTGFGVVLQPRFLPGFNASVDYYNIDIKKGIGQLTAQQILDACFSGNQSACALVQRITGNPAYSVIIQVAPVNLASQQARGVDFEASYQFDLADVFSNWNGRIGLRALATHYLRNLTVTGIPGAIASDTAGQNSGGGPPDWRYQVSLAYENGPVNATFTARGLSDGVYDNNWIECSSGCPTATATRPTVSNNRIEGQTFFDLGLTYKFDAALSPELFFNVRNLTNADPKPFPNGLSGATYTSPNANSSLYDTFGRVFRIGVRFEH